MNYAWRLNIACAGNKNTGALYRRANRAAQRNQQMSSTAQSLFKTSEGRTLLRRGGEDIMKADGNIRTI